MHIETKNDIQYFSWKENIIKHRNTQIYSTLDLSIFLYYLG